MKINKIKKLSSGKYKILFENKEKIITYDDVIIKNKILYNQNINSNTYQEINNDTVYYDIYNKTLNYISRKMRSKKEIMKFLEKFNLEENEKETIMKNLIDNGFINDIQFVKAFIADKLHLSNNGPHKIKEELLNHDIDESIIDEEFKNVNQEDIVNKLKKMIVKKANLNHKYSDYIFKQKLLYELVNLGYDKNIIISILDNQSFNNNNIIKSEYDKIYSKLSKKYQGNELIYKIKEKLYQKGFDIESINEILK
ncbi:MAG: RecX family transcriptional regulator [Bacilli bacterium]